MTLPGRKFTYEDYKQLPDDHRYEVLEGELVMTPAPNNRHQRILLRLAARLELFTQEHGLGTCFLAPTDLILSDKTVLQPDLLFVARNRESIIGPVGGVHGAPDLVVEILSPSTAKRDLEIKRQLYSTYGVREYWSIDPEARSIDVLTHQGHGLENWHNFTADGTLSSPVLPGWRIDLAQIFDA
jgi:Uma2 family endonuclease